MTTTAFVDLEGPLRGWLRTQVPELGGRVFLSLPERVIFPAVSMSLLDGGLDLSEAPVAHALVSFSVWSSNRQEAAGVAWELVSVFHTARMQPLGAAQELLGARVVTGPLFSPDPDGFARYVVDVAVSVRVT